MLITYMLILLVPMAYSSSVVITPMYNQIQCEQVAQAAIQQYVDREAYDAPKPTYQCLKLKW